MDVGDDGEGGENYIDNGAGAGYDLKYSRAVGVVTWEQELGCDRGHATSSVGIS